MFYLQAGLENKVKTEHDVPVATMLVIAQRSNSQGLEGGEEIATKRKASTEG